MDEASERRKRLEEKKRKVEELKKKREKHRQTVSATTQTKSSPTIPEASPHSEISSSSSPINHTLQESITNESSSSTKGAGFDAFLDTLLAAPVPGHQALQRAQALRDHLQQLKPVSGAGSTSIEPAIHQQYDRETQTDIDMTEEEQSEADKLLQIDESSIQTQFASPDLQKAEGKQVDNSTTSQQQTNANNIASENETKIIFASEEFRLFLKNASRPMERMLDISNGYDTLFNYLADESEGITQKRESMIHSVTVSPYSQDMNKSDKHSETYRLIPADTQFCAKIRHKPITSIQANTEFPELLLTAYSDWLPSFSMDYNSAHGVVAIWNTKALSAPEFVLQAHTGITNAFWQPDAPKCIVGGLSTGQVAIWDTRSSKLPVQTSSLVDSPHSSPISSLSLIGSQTAASLVSTSEDGVVCSWAPTQLGTPIMHSQLRYRPQQRDAQTVAKFMESSRPYKSNIDIDVYTNLKSTSSYDVAGGALSFARNDDTTIYVGSIDGCVYSGSLARSAVHLSKRFVGHTSDVSVVRHHPGDVAIKGKERSSTLGADIFATASSEWAVNIWSSRLSDTFLRSFDLPYGPASDIQWCPVKPNLLLAGDTMGYVHFIDVTADDTSTFSCIQASKYAITRLAWSIDARQVYVADCRGELSIWNIKPEMIRLHEDITSTLANLADSLQKQIGFQENHSQLTQPMEDIDTKAAENENDDIIEI